MRIVVQRVLSASVLIDGMETAAIGKGLLVLAGISNDDGEEDIQWVSRKLVSLRIFCDTDGLMNLSLQDINGELLLVSQFTLHASTRKGNRPSFIAAAKPEVAIPVYEKLIVALSSALGKEIQTGRFGADMKVSLVNDGPVTIVMDSKNKE